MPDDPISAVPSPALLREYELVDKDLPRLVIEAWQDGQRRSFLYAIVALVFGGLQALAIVVCFV
jgi:hypothetical protein